MISSVPLIMWSGPVYRLCNRTLRTLWKIAGNCLKLSRSLSSCRKRALFFCSWTMGNIYSIPPTLAWCIRDRLAIHRNVLMWVCGQTQISFLDKKPHQVTTYLPHLLHHFIPKGIINQLFIMQCRGCLRCFPPTVWKSLHFVCTRR